MIPVSSIRMGAKRRTGVAGLLVLGCLWASQGTAAALNHLGYWNSSTNPLSISGYGSTAKAYGSSKISDTSNGKRMYSYAHNKFTDGDNHRAYLEGNEQYNAGTCRSVTTTTTVYGVSVANTSECRAVFFDHDAYRTDGLNYTTSSWVAMTTKSFAVATGADRGRMTARLRIDIPWRTDPTTGTAISTPADTF